MDIKTELRELMDTLKISMTYVSTGTGIAKSTISMWLNDNYNGNVDKIADKINNFIRREKERAINVELPITDISISKYISEIGRLCHTKGKIGVCAGRAGLGKTIAVKEYTKAFLDTILIESDSGYTAKSLLLEIHKRLGLSGKGVGVLLVGRNILFENLRGYNNQYDQLYSRVKYHKLLDKLLLQDVIKILESAGQNTELAETYLLYSDGNTRRLEHLISHSISIAKINGKAEVDSAVIKHTSKLLMV